MYNSNLAPDVVKTALDLVWSSEFGETKIQGFCDATDPLFFKQKSTDRAAVITEQFQGTGYFEERSEVQDVAQGTARVGNMKTFTVSNWAKSIDISKNLFDDDQHDTINMLVKNMARNARLTRDSKAFQMVYGGFTGTTTTNDGVALFSNSHVTLAGDTVDNLETGALADATLYSTYVSLVQQKTQDGTLGGHAPAGLLVSTTLFKTAQEVTKSVLKAGGALNDLNFWSELYPGLAIRQSPFFGAAQGGSDTAYVLYSQDHSVTRWVRQAVNTNMIPYEFSRNNNYIYKGEYREALGAISYEGVVGNTGL